MQQFSSTVAGHIRFLLQSLNGSNSDSVLRELSQLNEYGLEGSILILQSCFDHINYGTDVKNAHLYPALQSLFRFILDKPNFSTVFCQSLRNETVGDGFLDDLSNWLCLSLPEKIAVGLALSESDNPDIRLTGTNFCMTQIEGLFVNPSNIESTEQIQSIFMFLHRCEGLSKHADTFTQMLSLMQLKEHVPLVLVPLLSDELDDPKHLRSVDLFYDYDVNDFDAIVAEMEKEISMADVMRELGYGCTADASKCKEILSLFSPLTEATVARIIGTVIRTNAGFEDNDSTFSVFLSAIGSNPASDLPPFSSWNVPILVDSIKQLAPEISWVGVMESLDHEGFYIPSEDAFKFFMSIYKHACQELYPLHAICESVWKNSEGQLSFLKYAVSAPPELFTFSHSVRQLAFVDAVHGLNFQSGQSNHAWLCLDLLDVLCQLAERGYAAKVQSMLKYPLMHCPEILLLGTAQIHTTYNLLQHEVASTVLPMVVSTASKKGLILHLWHVNHHLVLRGFVDALAEDLDNVERVLEVCQETKILNHVLERIPFSFAIRLASIASQKELLDLEKWLSDSLITCKEPFFEECLKYLKEIQSQTSLEVNSNRLNLTGAAPDVYSQTAAVILKVLQANAGTLTSNTLSDEIEKLHITPIDVSMSQQSDGVTDSASSNTYSDDIEAEANSYFQRMFSEQLTIDDMVKMLLSYKESSEKSREKSIFDCMISNLYEEYRFFPKYPERQLGLAAVLFGSIIKHQMVTHLTLGIALRCVLDSLRKPVDSKMFTFGTKALEQFGNRLDEWPQYCNHILQISHLRNTHPELVTYIDGVLDRRTHGGNGSVDQFNMGTAVNEIIGATSSQQGQQLSSSVQIQPRQQVLLDDVNKASTSMNSFSKPLLSGSVQSTSTTSVDAISTPKIQNALSTPGMLSSSPGFARTRGITSARFGSALNIETLVAAAERRETPIEAPSSEIQDKISFIINNISAANVEAKSKEFAEILKEQYYPWFAQYMVMKRASIEPNFHELYLKFLDKISSRALTQEIIKASYENCKVLLGSELIKSSAEERSLLKNLGSWLGKLTIGRNQVLRARDIDPKSLVIEAYEKGLMIAVIPFTSKILEPCQSSLAYQPPNPWTMGILALLVEIYAMPNLKMNLKFDIEVLFKNLGVQIKDVTPTSFLRDRVRVIEGNPDFSNKDIGPPQATTIAEDKSGVISALNQVDLPLEVATPSHLGGHPHQISQYAAPAGTLVDDEKLTAIGFSDQLPPAQGLLQPAASQSTYSMGQLPSSMPSVGVHVVVNSKLNNLGLQVHFQRVLPLAMDRAIKEIVNGIVQRSVSIATQTTKELVIKDYALESNESRIYNAAHLMVASLAGSLAHVTCKEPLRGSISSQLRNMLQHLNLSSEILEQAVQLVTNDNLDLGCAIIEQAATEKAVQTIDGEISQALSLRRKHRESLGSSIYDASMYAQGSMGVLPETLRPTPGRLSISQQRVYEDFVRLPWQNQQSNQSTNATLTAHSPSPGSASFPRTFGASSGQLNSNIYSAGPGNTGFAAAGQTVDLGSEELEPSQAQILSTAALNHIRASDGVGQQRSEVESDLVSPSLSMPALEPQPVDVSASVKDSGISTHSPSLGSASIGSGLTEPLMTTGDALDKYQLIALKLESALAGDGRETEIQSFVSEVQQIILRCVSRDEAALAVAQKVFKALYENGGSSFHVGAHLAILAAIRDVWKLVVKELTSWVIYSDEEHKFNKDITVGLIRRELLSLPEYNIHMVKLLDSGRNKAATEFAVSLLQTLVNEEPKVISELQSLVESLAKLATRPGSPESMQQLVESVKNPAASAGALANPSIVKEDWNRQARDKKISQPAASRGDFNSIEVIESDASNFQKQVSIFFAEWYRICELPVGNDTPCTKFVLQLHQNGLLRGDDISDRFFRILLEISVSHFGEVMQSSQQVQSSQPVQSSFLAIDIYSKLVYSILKYCPVDQGSSKLFLLPKILAVTVRSIQKDHDEKKEDFNPRPYFRLFINWLSDFGSLDPVHDGVNLQVLSAFANAFHALQPLKVPAFSFAWLELVSHRTFMPKLLTGNSQKGWPFLHRLLVELFQFMEPFLRNAELGELIRFLYKGTLRVLLVLLHDFPEFLCDYHFSFCDVIPPSCIQMRNIILSAFPRNMRLPDPSTPNLKIDLLEEMSQAPRILSEVDLALKTKQMKADVDEYLRTRQQGSPFLSDLKQRLLLPPKEASQAGTRYNVPLISSLVLYVGMQAIQLLQARNRSQPQSVSSDLVDKAALDIFQTLIMDLDTEGRYLFLNAIANQLRYPNTHTHYFSFILLYLFSDAHQEIIQEQITRVLLERLIVNRPHPWGLLITFIELIKNPGYNFWNHSFTRCAPEIEKLFESVSRSCGGPKPVNEGMVGSGALADSAH